MAKKKVVPVEPPKPEMPDNVAWDIPPGFTPPEMVVPVVLEKKLDLEHMTPEQKREWRANFLAQVLAK